MGGMPVAPGSGQSASRVLREAVAKTGPNGVRFVTVIGLNDFSKCRIRLADMSAALDGTHCPCYECTRAQPLPTSEHDPSEQPVALAAKQLKVCVKFATNANDWLGISKTKGLSRLMGVKVTGNAVIDPEGQVMLIFAGSNQIDEATRRFASSASNLEEVFAAVSYPEVMHSLWKKDFCKGKDYIEEYPDDAKMYKYGSPTQESKGNAVIITLAAPGLSGPATAGTAVVQRKRAAGDVLGRGLLMRDADTGATELLILLEDSGNSGSLVLDCKFSKRDPRRQDQHLPRHGHRRTDRHVRVRLPEKAASGPPWRILWRGPAGRAANGRPHWRQQDRRHVHDLPRS